MIERGLIEAWLDYYFACEVYDRVVCTGPILRDGIVPRTGEELAEINRNARRQMQKLRERFPFAQPREWHAAKMYVLDRYDLKAEYDRRVAAGNLVDYVWPSCYTPEDLRVATGARV